MQISDFFWFQYSQPSLLVFLLFFSFNFSENFFLGKKINFFFCFLFAWSVREKCEKSLSEKWKNKLCL